MRIQYCRTLLISSVIIEMVQVMMQGSICLCSRRGSGAHSSSCVDPSQGKDNPYSYGQYNQTDAIDGPPCPSCCRGPCRFSVLSIFWFTLMQSGSVEQACWAAVHL